MSPHDMEMNQHVIGPSILVSEGSLAFAKVEGVWFHPRVDTRKSSETGFVPEFLSTDST